MEKRFCVFIAAVMQLKQAVWLHQNSMALVLVRFGAASGV
jgi:hypothetical protein